MPDQAPQTATIVDPISAQMRTDAGAIFHAGLKAADPESAIQRLCHRNGNQLQLGEHRFDLSAIGRVLVVGAGKATAYMARAIEGLLGDSISDGVISVKYGHTTPLRRIKIVEAGHPLPDAKGVEAARRIMALVSTAIAGDLVLVLLSGGGSALLPLPLPGIRLADKQITTDLLLACGATIHEINAIRKHLSAIKGGRLAQAASQAALITLILSDVVGDDLDVIASGPTVPDKSTFGDCLEIINRYGISEKLPESVRRQLTAGAAGIEPETPKSSTHPWDFTRNLLIGSNRQALEASALEAQKRGYNTLILSSRIEGETHCVAQVHTAIAREVAAAGHPVAQPACILSGGETTVVVRGAGQGGRNQEFALHAALVIDACPAIVILSAGTDGSDGPTDAAGAFADHTTIQRAKQAGLDIHRHLTNNDAYPFFKSLGDLLITGPTGTNVMDLNIILVRQP
ncbi:MAG: glycerate kinase [Desulfobacteraceae bacterium]|nr:glycerate kinase [Desulfobacteraceae bacterium]